MNWNDFLQEEGKKEYFKVLKDFIKEERLTKEIYPAKEQLFIPFKYTPFDNVKVVILATEPYTVDVNDGLAWSVRSHEISAPLKNILEEVRNDWAPLFKDKDQIFKTNSLVQWAQQGALLWNVILTVEKKNPGAHKNKGWEMFTAAMLQLLSKEKKGVVYMLWGKAAMEMAPYINHYDNLVLTATHPHPRMANKGGWFGCRHFTKCDKYIVEKFHGSKLSINWFLL